MLRRRNHLLDVCQCLIVIFTTVFDMMCIVCNLSSHYSQDFITLNMFLNTTMFMLCSGNGTMSTPKYVGA